MQVFELGFVFIISYLIASLSFARIITKVWTGKDVTQFEIPVEGESETYKVISIGANSVSSQLGAKAGMLVSILDILKVSIPILLAKFCFPSQSWAPIAAGIAGMMGHIWPIYYKFHGGSGYSAIMGGLLIFDPLAIIITPLVGLFLGMIVFRNMIVAELSWLWLLIPWFWIRNFGKSELIVYAIAINVLFSLAMIPEIKLGMKYKKEGKIDAYMLGSLSSHPMGRGFLKMARALGVIKDDSDKENATDKQEQ